MHGIEFSIFRVARVESNGNDAGCVACVGHELRKDIREIEIRRELFGRFIENINCAALVVDEEPGSRQRSVSRFRAQRSRSAQLALEINRARSLSPMRGARERKAHEILKQDRRAVLADLRLRGILRG